MALMSKTSEFVHGPRTLLANQQRVDLAESVSGTAEQLHGNLGQCLGDSAYCRFSASP